MILYAQNGRNARSRSVWTNEEQVPKLDVVGSSPISRSIKSTTYGCFFKHPIKDKRGIAEILSDGIRLRTVENSSLAKHLGMFR
jgi:hypothetical protein